jgi:hypothetical protein
MTGLDAATTVNSTGDGVFSAELSPDWEIWGPQGGYLAAAAIDLTTQDLSDLMRASCRPTRTE